jgi:hypothetical protein
MLLYFLMNVRRRRLIGALDAEAVAVAAVGVLQAHPASEAMADGYALVAAVVEAAVSVAGVGVRRRVLEAPSFHTSIDQKTSFFKKIKRISNRATPKDSISLLLLEIEILIEKYLPTASLSDYLNAVLLHSVFLASQR